MQLPSGDAASEQAQVVSTTLQHGPHGHAVVGGQRFAKRVHSLFFFLGQVVAFGDNFGYGAWKAAYNPAQIDTQAVVRFRISSTTVFFLDRARIGRHAE